MSSLAKNAAEPSGASGDKIRVMIVDDSLVIRGLISRWLDALPDIEVVASCRNGKDAVDRVEKTPVDVVILDIEMPVMDGLTALPKILKASPDTKVVMASTLTRRNADISIRAMTMGASDYVPKPESMRGGDPAADFHHDLVEKVRTLGAIARGRRAPAKDAAAKDPATANKAAPTSPLLKQPDQLTLQKASTVPPRILAIGSSTGGPKALLDVLSALSPSLKDIPVVITQHMPATFTSILAEHIAGATKRPTCEGETGMVLEPGHIYVAPGGHHMLLESKGANVTIRLDDSPPINFCRPAVDPMMESLIPIYNSAILACILTGMGHDGRDGCAKVQAKGGTVIAQDERTSVVWGMPGAVALAGVCHKVLPLKDIGPTLSKLITGAAR